ILRPVVSVLMRHGLSTDELNEICRWLYVDEALKRREFWGRDKPFKSRIACVTGLSRKAVQNYSQYDSPEELVAETPGNRAARVQRGWLTDPLYRDERGQPRPIPFAADKGPSFAELSNRYSGDVTPRAILDELKRAGAVQMEKDFIRLKELDYVPDDSVELLDITGMSANDLLGTIRHNLDPAVEERYFQRTWYSKLVPAEKVTSLRQRIRERLKPVWESLYKDILDAADQKPEPGKKYQRVGIGAYYFQDN
ncbi:MAG: DUF6502 family protein, partial [Gammaproteobacteria bacterium]